MTGYEVCMVVLALCVAFLGLTLFLYIKTGDGGNWEWFFSKSYRKEFEWQRHKWERFRYLSQDYEGEEVPPTVKSANDDNDDCD